MGGYGGGGFGAGGYGVVNIPFPSTLKKPQVSIQQSYNDLTLRSEMENGLIFTRPRGTSIKRTWSVVLDHAPEGDLDLIDDFIRNTTIGGAMAFLWLDPRSDEQVTVRFSKLPQIADAGWATQKDDPGIAGLSYNISFELEEV